MALAYDRVRAHTAAAVLQRIDEDTTRSLLRHCTATSEEVGSRLEELDREWDSDRAIELEAAITGLAGLALGVFVKRELLAVPAFVGAAVLVHALTGWYPLAPVLRRMGVRSSREIARERYALKALRGDFADMDVATPSAAGARIQ